MQFRIVNFIGHVHTFGIPGTEKCDIAAVTTSYAETANNSPAPTQLSTVYYRDLLTPKILRLMSTPTAALATHCR